MLRLLFAAFWAAVTLSPALAQYPDHTIRIIVPVPPGAAPDLTARLVAEGMADKLGKPVIVENRGGANGNIAGEAVARSAADGYTLLFGIDSAITVNPHLYKMSYNPMSDFVPVASLVSNQLVLATNPSVPAKNLTDLVAYANKAKPSLTYGSGGLGSQQHLAMEMLKQRAGIKDMLHVPYKGAVAAVTGTLAGQNMLGFSGSASTGFIQAGKLNGIAVTGKRRSRVFPELPTIGETYSGYEVEVWFGLFAPKGTPEPVLAKLREVIKELRRQPEFIKRVQSSGSVEVLDLTTEEFKKRIQDDHAKYGKLIKEVGIR